MWEWRHGTCHTSVVHGALHFWAFCQGCREWSGLCLPPTRQSAMCFGRGSVDPEARVRRCRWPGGGEGQHLFEPSDVPCVIRDRNQTVPGTPFCSLAQWHISALLAGQPPERQRFLRRAVYSSCALCVRGCFPWLFCQCLQTSGSLSARCCAEPYGVPFGGSVRTLAPSSGGGGGGSSGAGSGSVAPRGLTRAAARPREPPRRAHSPWRTCFCHAATHRGGQGWDRVGVANAHLRMEMIVRWISRVAGLIVGMKVGAEWDWFSKRHSKHKSKTNAIAKHPVAVMDVKQQQQIQKQTNLSTKVKDRAASKTALSAEHERSVWCLRAAKKHTVHMWHIREAGTCTKTYQRWCRKRPSQHCEATWGSRADSRADKWMRYQPPQAGVASAFGSAA